MNPHAPSAVRRDLLELLSLAMVMRLSLKFTVIVLLYITRKEIKLGPLDRREQKQDNLTIPMVLLLLLIYIF